MVRPKYYRKMHKKVSRITGLKSEDLTKALAFPDAFKKLSRFCGKDFIFLTWGTEDIPILRDNLKLHSLDSDWIPQSFDLQVFFASQIAKEHRQFALEDAIEMLGEKPFQAHDALCDARSTAIVCRHLDMEEGFRNYARLAGDITAPPLETKELGVTFENRNAALQELISSPIACPRCSDYLYPEHMFPQNTNKYLSLVSCTDGEEYLVRFKMLRAGEKGVRVIREIFLADDALLAFYHEKEDRYQHQKEAERARAHRKRQRKKAMMVTALSLERK